MNIRTEMHWRRVLDEAKTIYVVGNPIEAYAIVAHKIDFWEPQWINELVWTSEAGYRSILALLAQICINKSALEWWEPWPSPFLQRYQDAGVKAEMDRTIMYRILNLESCLAKSGIGMDDYSIEDDLIPENNLAGAGSGDGKTVRQALSIGETTQLLLGEQLLDLSTSSKSPHQSAYCLEFF